MNERLASTKPLCTVYSVLALAASLAAIKALVWPRWPEARPLDQPAITRALKEAGLAAVAINPLPAKRSAELATSEAIGYSLDNGQELRVMRGVARRRFNLQTAFLTSSQPALHLKTRHLVSAPVPYADGLIKKQPALQTCLVQDAPESAAFGVTRDQLTALIDKTSQTRWSNLKAAIGLQPNRVYQCIVIQVKSVNKTQQTIDQAIWLKLLSAAHASLPSRSSEK